MKSEYLHAPDITNSESAPKSLHSQPLVEPIHINYPENLPTTLNDEAPLSSLVDDVKLLFKNSDRVRAGAEEAYSLINKQGSEGLLLMVSPEVAEAFAIELTKTKEWREKVNMDSGYLLQPRGEGKKGFRRVIDTREPGELILNSNLHFWSETDSNITQELSTKYEDDKEARYGAFLVLTLKDWELKERERKAQEALEKEEQALTAKELQSGKSQQLAA